MLPTNSREPFENGCVVNILEFPPAQPLWDGYMKMAIENMYQASMAGLQ